MFLPKRVLRPEIFLSASTEHSNKDKVKDRDREEREKKKVTEREREKEKKKHKMMNEIKRENGEVKQPIKGWWETHTCILIYAVLKVLFDTEMFIHHNFPEFSYVDVKFTLIFTEIYFFVLSTVQNSF